MILEATSGLPPTHEPCLADYVDGLFAGRDPAERLNDTAVREVACALEAYACADGGNLIETGNLAVLASSAVRALGRDDLAVEAFVVGSGIIYPQKLACAEDAPVWIVDTERLFPDRVCITELAFFSVFYRLVGDLVHLWDPDLGRGALGIRKLRLFAEIFAGGKGGQKAVDEWTRRIRDTVSDRMTKCSADRGWKSVPAVLMLD